MISSKSIGKLSTSTLIVDVWQTFKCSLPLQIDYILVNDTSLLCQVLISDQLPTNMSSHVSVKATLNVSLKKDVMKQKKLSSKAVTKLLWEKADEK